MPIIVQQQGSPGPIPGVTLTAANILTSVSNDLLLRMGPQHPSLLDYVNRIQLDLLKWSRWKWLLSPVQRFITIMGQTDYWIGAGPPTQTAVQTNLQLPDVQFIKEGTVFNRSNWTNLSRTLESPNILSEQFPDASYRLDQPRSWRYDVSTPNILSVYPAANNQNDYQPVPEAPILGTAVSGSLPAQNYYFFLTFVDSSGGESAPSNENFIFCPAGTVATIASPTPAIAVNANGVAYNAYNVYGALTTNSEVLQTSTPIAVGVPWQMPPTGLIGGRTQSGSTIAEVGGYVIEFRYYRQRPFLTSADTLLYIPNDYFDAVVAGVNSLGYQYLSSTNAKYAVDAAYWDAQYRDKRQAIIRDKNLFPTSPGNMIMPDYAASGRTYLNDDPYYSGVWGQF